MKIKHTYSDKISKLGGKGQDCTHFFLDFTTQDFINSVRCYNLIERQRVSDGNGKQERAGGGDEEKTARTTLIKLSTEILSLKARTRGHCPSSPTFQEYEPQR